MLGIHPLGLYEKALRSSDPWEIRLKKARDLGFDYMEISIDEQDERMERLYWPAEKREKFRELIYRSGIPIRSMCLSVHRRCPFGSADPQVRQQAHDLMERAIEFAAHLGIRVIQLAGYDVYYEESTPESIALFREGIKWAAQRAASSQVMLAMEIMDTPLLNSITKFKQYAQEIRCPWFQVYPDLGNLTAWPENNVEQELSKGIDSIVAVHLKDTLAVTDQFPGQFKNLPFGEGCVDFPARFRQLEKLGYCGPYMMEMWHQLGTDDVAQVEAARSFIQDCFAQAIAPRR